MGYGGTPVVVVGAGLAGLTAAIHLAEAGEDVLLCEAHPTFLGGRTRAREPYRFGWRGRDYEHSFDHGQHCMWAQYWNMRALLDRLGILATSVRPCATTRYLVDDGEEVHRLAPFDVDPANPPATLFHFFAHLAGAMRVPGWRVADSARLAVAMPKLFATWAFDHGRNYDAWDAMSVHEMFAWLGLPAQLEQIFKSMCKASTFHAHTEISASWGLSMMATTMIGHPEDHKMWCFRGDLGTHLIDPLAAAVRRSGGRILRNATAVDLEREGDRITAIRLVPTGAPAGSEALATETWQRCSAVVGATDIPGFQRWLLPALADVPGIRAVANLEGVGSVTTRVVTARRVRDRDPWMGIFSGKFHALDTYFLLSRYQDEFMPFEGEVIELHSYLASRELAASSPEVVRALVTAEVERAWPELAGQIIHIESAANERTFDKQGVGHAKYQPRMRTAVPNLVLAGSWIKTDDAVHDMEKAVVTGIRAANVVLGTTATPILPLRPRSLLQRVATKVAPTLPVPPAASPPRSRRVRAP